MCCEPAALDFGLVGGWKVGASVGDDAVVQLYALVHFEAHAGS